MSTVLDFLQMAVPFSKIISVVFLPYFGMLCAEVLTFCLSSIGKRFKSGIEGRERGLHFHHLFRKTYFTFNKFSLALKLYT